MILADLSINNPSSPALSFNHLIMANKRCSSNSTGGDCSLVCGIPSFSAIFSRLGKVSTFFFSDNNFFNREKWVSFHFFVQKSENFLTNFLSERNTNQKVVIKSLTECSDWRGWLCKVSIKKTSIHQQRALACLQSGRLTKGVVLLLRRRLVD